MSGKVYVGFALAGVRLAVEAARVRGIGRADKIIAVPFARGCVAGVIVREGRLVAVLDLSLVPSIWNEVPDGGGSQVVVLSAGETEAGLLADAAEAFVAPEEEARSAEAPPPPRPPPAFREAILSGAVSVSGRTYGLLKIDAALAAAGVPGS